MKKDTRDVILMIVAYLVLVFIVVSVIKLYLLVKDMGNEENARQRETTRPWSTGNTTLGPYSDAEVKAGNVGDFITFGSYEQDNDLQNGKEDIEWQILEVKQDRMLVISRYALEHQPYHSQNEDVTWETSSIRAWLNNDFLNSAFSREQQEKILSLPVAADKNPDHDTPVGLDTEDAIFLLSCKEASKYYTYDSLLSSECKGTPYFYASSMIPTTLNDNCSWWLRTPGASATYAAVVGKKGVVYTNGERVSGRSFAVRPVMWLKIEP